ncbi:hypothetical protein [Klebsiella variicola]|uniref:hypothetical protein n=1 Tax=Klebsiella variicola TaxID=244366 RepID=UPI0005B61650|nr:hypothetical protein [Klebsiella variicola]CEP30654.1 conserved hypothetical protein [Klebsiella variicola]
MATQFENGLTLSQLAERNAELVTEVEKLRAERNASLNEERVWEKTMMEVCGEDGPASVASEIRSLQALRDTAMQALKSQVEQLAAENVALALENVAMKQIVDSVTNLDNEPQYHAEGMGCGLEDRGITDRYDACRYGWDEAMERIYGDVIPCAEELDFSATVRIVAAQRSAFVDEAVSKIAESGALTVGDCIVAVCQLREGADK